MKRSTWLRLIAVILIISMLAVPVSAATVHNAHSNYGLIGNIIGLIRDIIRDIFDDWFDDPGHDPDPTVPAPTPTEPVVTEPTPPDTEDPTDPSAPVETDPTEPSAPAETDPTEPGQTDPTVPTEPEENESSLELVEGHANAENGYLLRGVTYNLVNNFNSQPVTAQSALRNAANALRRNPAAALSLNAVTVQSTTIADTALEITYDENGNAVIENGQYALGIVGGKYVTNVIAYSDWGYTLSGTSSKDSATVWTITRQADGSYTVQDPNNEYLSVTGLNKATMSATPVYFSIQQYGSNTVLKQLNAVNENCYLNALGSITSSSFGGWTEGSPICLYALTTTEPEQPEEPEQPDTNLDLIYFPVTMFNYKDSVLRELTHQAEVEAGLKDTWQGLYFSGGSPAPTTYTYNSGITAHSDLTWQQVMDGTYYADEACTNQVTVAPIQQGTEGYAKVSVSGDDLWNSAGGSDLSVWYKTPYFYHNSYYDQYCPVSIIDYGYGYFYVGYEMQNNIRGIGYYYPNDQVTLYANASIITGYTLTAGDSTLATLDGTKLNVKVDFTLYSSGNTTVTKPYAAWNWWSYKPANNDSDNAQNKFYAGLVQDELVNNELKFNIPEPGIFTFDRNDPTNTNDGIKDIYQNVGLPFVIENGFYTFDSDAHGTYFADINRDGRSDPGYGTSDNYFNMHFDRDNTQGWDNMNLQYGDQSYNLWAPFNTNDNDNYAGEIDYHFGMRADIPFSMTHNGRVNSTNDNSDPITFEFQGDDDVWIFIDGHLVIDLGGIHNRLRAKINFAENTITYSLPESNKSNPIANPFGAFNIEGFELTQKLYDDANGEGALGQTRPDFSSKEAHTMSIFYLERGEGTSNCKIQFNLPMRDTLLVTKDASMSWSAEQDRIDGDGDGTAPLTAREQAAVNRMRFGFTLYKKEANAEGFTPVASTNYYLQDADGNVKDILSTDANGHFYLKNGETAKFMTDFPVEGVTYYVVEDAVPKGFLTPDFKYDGVTTWGMWWYDSTSENAPEYVHKGYEIPEHELPMDATENKSYIVTAKGSIESIDSLEFICVNYLNEELPNPTALAMEDTIVIDYGLPVQIDPIANDLFRGNEIEIVAWGDENLTLDEAVDEHGHAIEAETKWSGAVDGDTADMRFGKVTFKNVKYSETLNEDGELIACVRDTFEYELTEQLTEVEVISYIVKVTSTLDEIIDGEVVDTKIATRYALAKIYIVPATIMYYEENFGDLIQLLPSTGEILDDEINDAYVSAFQEPGVVGDDSNSTYGSDVAYLHDSEDSNGTSMHFDTTNGYVRFQYTFTGTGTTFFARTAADTGYMQVLLFKGVMQPDENGGIGHYSGKQMATYYRDTYFEDTEKLLPDEGNTLYNIPVYTTDGLDYGTYTVVVTVAKENTPGAGPADVAKTNPSKHTCHNEHGEEIVVAKNTAGHICRDSEGEILYTNGSGDQFYLDGIRIMRPLNENSSVDLVDRALDAYETDGETNLDVVTLRQKLITDVEDGEIDWSKEQFVMLTDTNGNLVKPEDYITIGPKEEVYLAKGQTVSFALKFWQPDGLKLYMGMKAPFGEASLNIGHNPYPLYNTVDSYYDVTNDYETLTLVEEQIVDTEGNGLYYDSEDKIYIKVVNADKTYYFCDEEYNEVTIEDESELKPLMQEYYVVTYTFTATSHIVSLTNIKVVGSHEFTIIPGYDIHIPGSNGGTDTDAPTPEEEVQP